jgi:hypothetical protein
MTATASGLKTNPRPCRCGGRMESGVRIGPALGQRTNVLVCFSCAHEEPSLYGRSHYERNRGIRNARPGGMPGAWMDGRLALARRIS